MIDFGNVTMIARMFMKRRFRNKASTAMLLLVPIAVAFIFGVADQRANSTLTVGVVRPVAGTHAAELVKSCREADALYVRTFSSVDNVRRAVERGDVVAGVDIPPDYDPSAAVTSESAVRVLGKPTQSSFVAVRADVMLIAARQSAIANSDGAGPTQPVVLERVTAHAGSTATGLGRATAGMLVFFMFDSCLFMGAILVEERGRGCVMRMSTTPNTRVTIVSGEVLGRALICAIQAIVIVIAGQLLFGVHWGNPFGVVLIIAAFALVGTSASMVIGFRLVGEREQIASSFAPLLGVLGLLGGCFWSLAIVPSWLRTLGHVSPQAWANDGFDKLLATDAGIVHLWLPLLVLTGFAVALFVIAVGSMRGALRR